MTKPVVFDTWVWVEVLRGTPVGASMAHAYLDDPNRDVWTADISLVELAASMHRDGFPLASIRVAVEAVAARSSKVLYPDTADAVSAAFGRAALRLRKKDASLADGLILAMARNRGADIVTCDEAFQGEPDVICPKA